MITRFYVDNYKCLVNFEYKPKAMELIIGSNGSGKTTVFEALSCIQEFVLNQKKTSELFSWETPTRWQNREAILFELGVESEEKKYKYELLLDVDRHGSYSIVKGENLYLNGKMVVESHLEREEDFDDNGFPRLVPYTLVSIGSAKGTREFRVSDMDRSVMSYYADDFKKLLREIIFVRLNPSEMRSIVTTSERRPVRSFANFPAYYFHLLQEKQNFIFDLLPILRENIDGFRSFVLEEGRSETRELKVEFAVEGAKKGQTIRYDFTELSDGQRALIALYTLAFCESGSTLLIDEPENFISSRELQPWLMLLRERIEEFGGQAILISHHPEFINVLAPQDAIQFRRKDGGPVMLRPFETAPYQGLTPAEIVARGWENE